MCKISFMDSEFCVSIKNYRYKIIFIIGSNICTVSFFFPYLGKDIVEVLYLHLCFKLTILCSGHAVLSVTKNLPYQVPQRHRPHLWGSAIFAVGPCFSGPFFQGTMSEQLGDALFPKVWVSATWDLPNCRDLQMPKPSRWFLLSRVRALLDLLLLWLSALIPLFAVLGHQRAVSSSLWSGVPAK